MNKLILIIGLATALYLTTLICNFNKAQAASDHAEVIVGKKTYKFAWDYHREGSDVAKNSHPKQDTVSAMSGSVIGAKVFTCCGDFEGLIVSLTKDKEKITNSGLE